MTDSTIAISYIKQLSLKKTQLSLIRNYIIISNNTVIGEKLKNSTDNTVITYNTLVYYKTDVTHNTEKTKNTQLSPISVTITFKFDPLLSSAIVVIGIFGVRKWFPFLSVRFK